MQIASSSGGISAFGARALGRASISVGVDMSATAASRACRRSSARTSDKMAPNE